MLSNSTNKITRTFERAIERLADKLDISDTHHEAAKRSYTSVGEWLNRSESGVAQYAPAIYSHGSFRLGTVIRPPTGEDCFDLDVVCEVNCSKDLITQEALKIAIGRELKEYVERHGMKELEQSQYCWTLRYADSAQFHMDVLPAIPDAQHQRMLLERLHLGVQWVDTAIGLTNTKHPNYRIISRDWPPSNPRGYSEWFFLRMQQVFVARRRAIALAEGKTDIEKIPEYRVKTPLQQAVQILKRHRDGTFSDRPDVKPASIIITTLAAHAYNQEESLVGALFAILSRMDLYVEDRQGVPWIKNPSDPRENFADRWVREPALKASFYEWLDAARADFRAAAALNDEDAIVTQLSSRMGRALLERALSGTGPGIVSAGARRTAQSHILSAPHKQAPIWPALAVGSSYVRIASATVARRGFRPARIGSNGAALSKNCDLKFEADTNVQWPYDVYWQVVNTGNEARAAGNLRGGFEPSRVEHGHLIRRESTRYSGTHSIECFIVKNGYCVAQSGPFIVNIK